MTGTYRLKTGFHGPTNMPIELQKAMDYTIIGLQSTFCLLDDVLTVIKVPDECHLKSFTDFLT